MAKPSHDLFEHLPPVLVVLELIEAGAGGGEQDYVSRLRHRVGFAYGVLQGLGMHDFSGL